MASRAAKDVAIVAARLGRHGRFETVNNPAVRADIARWKRAIRSRQAIVKRQILGVQFCLLAVEFALGLCKAGLLCTDALGKLLARRL